MKKVVCICCYLICILPLVAQEYTVQRERELGDVVVTAERLLSNIGIQQTILDSTTLRHTISASLADVLTQNSTIFIKSYGRATLSTASFRGTAPSHTQVTWNGMKINSPMLGQVDFSLIPSFLIDKASLYHGASSTGITGGALGGAIALGTQSSGGKGLGLQYIQGIGSYRTWDEFLRIQYGSGKWESSTRALYSSSRNDFPYNNYNKKDFQYNDEKEIIGFTYPKERNKNGSFKDLHLMQEVYYKGNRGQRASLYGWYMHSDRGIPMLNVDYKEENDSKNRQVENTLRLGAQWEQVRGNGKYSFRGGYTYTDLNYTYLADIGTNELSEMIHSQSYVHTAMAEAGGEYSWLDKWMLTGRFSGYQHSVDSRDRAITTTAGTTAIIGYNKSRTEISGLISLRYTPVERLGFAVNLREEYSGSEFTPLIPAAFADYLVSRRGSVRLKTSITRNYRYPTLNDLYFMPGGNDTLHTEKGYTYDGGIEFAVKQKQYQVKGEVTVFDSHIRDWIVWLPTFKGFWSPVNVKKVHSYGVEVKATTRIEPTENWWLSVNANYVLTRSINQGDPASWGDESIGKQLVYIPEHASAITAYVGWKYWQLTYKWNYYSERYTTSSNNTKTQRGVIHPYYMNDIALEKMWETRWATLSCKLLVNNLFNEEYESVLSRPMAGRNYNLYIGITPKLRK